MKRRVKEKIKLIGMMTLIAAYGINSILLFWLTIFSENRYRRINAHLISFYSRLLLSILGCRIHVRPDMNLSKKNRLIVSNHLSYLDVLILSSCLPACYVTSQEIKETPFLGFLTQLAGCLYVERRSRDNLGSEIGQITNALENDLNVVIFPEGTSTDGSSVLRFRQPLFQSAIHASKDILPLSLNYRVLNGISVTSSNRDTLFWYADMTFWNHFEALSKIENIQVELAFSTPICIRNTDTSASLSIMAHEAVSNKFIPIC